jgi:phage terminase large subunit
MNDGRFFIVLPTYKQAKLTAWDMLKDLSIQTGQNPKINETELLVRFDNGSTIRLVGSDTGDSLRGTTMDGVCMDEWALQDPEVFTKIIVPALSDRNGWIVKSTTPSGQNHAYEDWEKSNKKHFYPVSFTNVFSNEMINKLKAEMSEDEFNQEYLCQFLAYAGLVYNNFNESVHVVEPFDVPKEWTRLVGIDYGQTNPTAIPLIAIDYDGNCYIYDDEIYTSNQSVEDTSKILLNKLIGCKYYAYIDPSTMAKDHTRKLPDGSFNRYSVFQEFQNNNVAGLMLGINQVLAGINKVKQLFAQNKLFIFSNCTNVLDEIRHYRWKQSKNKDVNAPETPVKVKDHAMDAIKYSLTSYFEATPRVEPNRYKAEDGNLTLEGWEKMEKMQKKTREVQFV